MLQTGLYEQLITTVISQKLSQLDRAHYYVHTTKLDPAEASRYLSLSLSEAIRFALDEIKDGNRALQQIELANRIIGFLAEELPNSDFSENLIDTEGKILEAVLINLDSGYADLAARVREIMPYTRLSQSELFTGSNAGISLESELKKEILSADEICWLVSFIRFSAVRIFAAELEEFTHSSRKLKIITTSYMGATEAKAIDFLSKLPNTTIKISYNTSHERLHAKAYLFLRKSGFHTGYIGSSNLSRSALTNGLEWNLKVTSREIHHIVDKCQKTFDTYWEDKDFELYESGRDDQKLRTALSQQSLLEANAISTFFDLNPFPYQSEILEKLQSEREVHHRFRNLVVAATGTGKTVISAFDYKKFKNNNPRARLLFIAHRQEILKQAQQTYKHVLRDANFGELWVDGQSPSKFDYVFASIQTLTNQHDTLSLTDSFYDYVVIDEVHHITAESYRPILKRFTPLVLLGLTATPERTDGADILKDFSNVIAAEIRLPEALNRKLLCPFQYFGLSDNVDLTQVSWRNGRYEIGELTRVYTENDRRVNDILSNCERYLTDINKVTALGFCVSIEHAKFMADKFILAGLKAACLTSENSDDRVAIRQKLQKGEINYLFVRDIFNEGVDIPEIDTVLFLRPTESLTIFLQQLGRGLRLADGKDCLTVLDFVGNSRPEYDFEYKFRALVGKTHTSIVKEIEDDFPHLPLGCSIILEKKAKKIILDNIKQATGFNRKQLVEKIKNFRHQSTMPLTLKNFLDFHGLEPQLIYKKGSWKQLCYEADIIPQFDEPNAKEIIGCIKRLLRCNSMTYLNFSTFVISDQFDHQALSSEEKVMLLMLHYDLWQQPGPQINITAITGGLARLALNPTLKSELAEILDLLKYSIDFIERPANLPFIFPLKLHSRYNRNQILVALGLHTFEKASSNREGVAENKVINAEALFITLKKSEREYSPTTMYEDYAINDTLFHWQSQNATSENSVKGLSYIHHQRLGKKILIFVREQNDDEYGITMPYIFLGEGEFVSSQGSKPMSIEWRLKQPMPAYLWKDSGKLAVG
ncbi:DEAD/DEAH box helicase [Flavitalea sp.]|nr:DUF3427 domain-containing protein [Flavitalea sp.]